MQKLLETYDNPVNLSEWFSSKPKSHLRGGMKLNHFQPTRLEMVSDNQLTQATDRTFSYDNDGSMTAIAQSAGNIALTYDSDNQLTQYTQDTTSLAYQYDALGNRIKKTQGSAVIKYIVDPNRGLPSVLCETNSSGAITAYYVYGLGLISKITGNSAYFYQYDGIGSTVALTDNTGNIKNKYAYDDFGNIATNSIETIANSFKYVGKYGVMTDLNDLLHMRARYYVPSIGRFTQYDPIGAVNPYIYVSDNPINLIDPSGNQEAIERVIFIVLIIAAAHAIQQYAWNNRGICMFSKGKKDPRWYGPGMPGDKIRQYEQSQPGNFESPPQFPKKGGWWKKVIWAIGKIAEIFYKG